MTTQPHLAGMLERAGDALFDLICCAANEETLREQMDMIGGQDIPWLILLNRLGEAKVEELMGNLQKSNEEILEYFNSEAECGYDKMIN